MFAKTYSAQLLGLTTELISVEIDVSKGLHSFSVVGLADKAVDEAKDRINAAIKNSGFKSPARGNRKIIVSLVPANIKKTGSYFDLAIALSYLKAVKEIDFETEDKIFLGELSLDGKVQPIKGVLLLTEKAKKLGFKEIYIPKQNTKEAGLIDGIKVFGVDNLKELTDHLNTKPKETKDKIKYLKQTPPTKIKLTDQKYDIDMSDVRGQKTVKRGLLIAAAGGHNIAMFGSPGTGKSMLAKAFSGILPPLSFDETIEVTGIHSAAGVLRNRLITKPPIRNPHHTASFVAISGGGATPKPGEITLSHRGVLFLDEFPEFDRKVIETLRGPLEDKQITVSRQKGSDTFPANFILVAAMNPCPCGHKLSKNKDCVCSPRQLNSYSRKISGPIADRIDIWLNVPEVKHEDLSKKEDGETSKEIRAKVIKARNLQAERFEKENIKINSEMNVNQLDKFCPLTQKGRAILNQASEKLGLSARAYHRIIKLSRTIADLENAKEIKDHHILEALQYRENIDN